MNPTRAPYQAARFFILFVFFVPPTLHAAPQKAPVISLGKDGHLAYEADERGNRVPDFSLCGYTGGDRPLPNAPVCVVIEPRPGDSTERIQQAIDYVASLPLDTNGCRGAVLLLKGRHEVRGGLFITNSGVVVRGQGMNEDGTQLVAAGLDRRTLIRVAGHDDRTTRTNPSWQLAEDHVPFGVVSFRLKDAGGLKPGDTICLVRPSTQQWIERLGATEFGGGVGGGWKPGTR
ncbi:MAG TPA: pectate lyase, partial [Verrucomicrobiae bacterium]|nr:pectate lyase [Verrucomicrobiae bacterium]